MQVRSEPDGSREIRFVYPFEDLLPKETFTLLRIRWSISQVEKLTPSLHITDQQFHEFEAVSSQTDISVSVDERARLSSLFDRYLSVTDKSVAKEDLVRAVVAIDVKYHDRTMQRIENIAGQIKNILHEDQLRALIDRLGL
jgi:hypothetical protein